MTIRLKLSRQPAQTGRAGAAGRLLARLKRELDRRVIRDELAGNGARQSGRPRKTDEVTP